MTDILALDRSFRCPVCERRFGDQRALIDHMTLTTKHENVVTYIHRLEFLLADAEDNLKFWREARRA
jgi:hypothetical protein